MVDAPERGRPLGGRRDAEEVCGVRGLTPLARRRRKAVAGVRDRVLEKGVPVDRRVQHVAAQDVSLPPAGYDPRNGQRRRPAAHGDRRAEPCAVGVEVGGRGRATRGVQRAERVTPAVVDQPEAVTTHTVHVRVDDGDGGRGGDGGVHGVATALQDRQSGLGGEGVRRDDEPTRRAGLGPSRRWRRHASIMRTATPQPCMWRLTRRTQCGWRSSSTMRVILPPCTVRPSCHKRDADGTVARAPLISIHDYGRFGARNGANEHDDAGLRGDDQS